MAVVADICPIEIDFFGGSVTVTVAVAGGAGAAESLE